MQFDGIWAKFERKQTELCSQLESWPHNVITYNKDTCRSNLRRPRRKRKKHSSPKAHSRSQRCGFPYWTYSVGSAVGSVLKDDCGILYESRWNKIRIPTNWFLETKHYLINQTTIVNTLPDCLQAMQTLGSGLDRFGLTRSMVKPLGRLGIAGKGTNTFLTASTPFLGGGEILSPLFLFLADCLVFGGEILDTK